MPKGRPLSAETKRKISEALKRLYVDKGVLQEAKKDWQRGVVRKIQNKVDPGIAFPSGSLYDRFKRWLRGPVRRERPTTTKN